MVTKKEEFIKSFLPDKIEDIRFAQIDLDITDLSLSDVLRNANSVYPINSRARNAIEGGRLAIGILCKSELLYPMTGILLIISDGENNIEIIARSYIVIVISEDRIKNDEDIKLTLDDVTKFILKEFKWSISKFNEFYVKFVYDPYEEEMEAEEEDVYIEELYKRLLGKG